MVSVSELLGSRRADFLVALCGERDPMGIQEQDLLWGVISRTYLVIVETVCGPGCIWSYCCPASASRC